MIYKIKLPIINFENLILIYRGKIQKNYFINKNSKITLRNPVFSKKNIYKPLFLIKLNKKECEYG